MNTSAMPSPTFFPPQDQWSEEEFLSLQNGTAQLVELSDGQIEVLPMADPLHQGIVIYLLILLKQYVASNSSGAVFCASLPIRLWQGKYRDPDVAYFRPGRITDPRQQPKGADLVIEVVNDDEEGRKRDLQTKRQEYAQAGISEYWIVDPQTETILVLVLDGGAYRVHGQFTPGATATSVLLPALTVDVTAVFDAGRNAGGAR